MAANGVQIATAYVQIVPSFQGVQGAISKGLAGAGAQRAGMAAGKEAGEAFHSSFKAKVSTVAKVATGLIAGFAGGTVIKSGLDRLTTIQDATTALNVQFQDTGKTAKFMDQILKTVQGTPFNLDQFAQAGKNLVAFGVNADKVPGYLKSMGEAAAASGNGAEAVDTMARAFGAMATEGHVTRDSINRIEEQGVPAMRILANHFGVTTTEMGKMVTKGTVPAAEGMDALSTGIMKGTKGIAGTTVAFGGSMEALRKTFSGAFGGMKASVARFGAGMLKPWLDDMTAGMTGAAGILDTGGKWLAVKSQQLRDIVVPALKDMWSGLGMDADARKRLDGSESKMVRFGAKVREVFERATEYLKTVVVPAFKELWSGLGMDADARAQLTGTESLMTRIGANIRAAWEKVGSVLAAAWASIKAGDSTQFLDQFKGAGETMAGFGEVIQSVLSNLPSLSDIIDVAARLFGFLADNIDTVITLLPVIIAAWGAYKLSQAAANVAALASLPIQAAQVASQFALASAMRATIIANGGVYQGMLANAAANVKAAATWVMHTASLVAHKVASLAVSAATKAWAAVQWLLNAALSANPIAIVVVALAALAAAVVWAWNNVDWFRDAVLVAWEWIKTASVAVWEGFLKPIFDNFVAAIKNVGTFFSWLYNTVILPVWELIKGAFQMYWDYWLHPIFEAFVWALQRLGDVFKWLWHNIVEPVWAGIKSVVNSVWVFLRDVVFAALQEKLRAIGGFFQGLRDKVGQVWEGIKSAISLVWTYLRDSIFRPLGEKIETIKTWFTGLKTKVAEIWDGIKKKLKDTWDWINQHVFAPLNLGVSTIGSFFGTLWQTVQDIWGKITGFFKGMAESIAQAVQDVKKGIEEVKKLISGVGDALSSEGADLGNGNKLNVDLGGAAGGLQDIGKFFGWFARGGVIPGYRPGHDTGLAALSPGEGILRPEVVRKVGPDWIYGANYAGKHGLEIPHFAGGGVFGQFSTNQFRALGSTVGAHVYKWSMDTVAQKTGKAINDGVQAAMAAGGGAFSSNGAWGPVNMSGFAANTAAAKAYIEKSFGGVSSIGGLYGGSVSGSDHPFGKALDVMIANYASPAGIAAGTNIANWFIKNPNAFGTKYVIWRDRINQNGAWSAYSHPGGNNDTLAHRDHVHLSFLTGTGQFSGTGTPKGDSAKSVGGMIAKLAQGIVGNLGFGTSALPSGGDMVERWRGTVLRALSIIGQPASLANTVLNQIRTESSGDPNAINLTDINAQRGYPSRGLVQTIPQTFAAYALPPWNKNIVDPLSNIISGMRYAIDRYGSIAAGMRGVAYDTGGWLMPGGVGVNLTKRPEPILTDNQWDVAAAALEQAQSFGGGNGVQMTVYQLPGQNPADLAREINRRLIFVGV